MKNLKLVWCLLAGILIVSCKSDEEKHIEANFNKYKSNTLNTGETPYSFIYGESISCSELDCSNISVSTSEQSNVIVSVKDEYQNVVYHAYIKANDYHSFSLPNGSYQVFFYYGNGWDPSKKMKVGKKQLIGGFLESESFGKDDVISLENNRLSYELISQINGNFSTSPSNMNEAF
jgi:hypothetical protein